MKKLLTLMLLAGALGAWANPAPADAAVRLTNCLGSAIDSCDSDFSGSTEKLIGIRGWCYAIRWGMCGWLGG
jgi:hypothetical protein